MTKKQSEYHRSATVRFEFGGKVLASKLPGLIKFVEDMQLATGSFVYKQQYSVQPPKGARAKSQRRKLA